MQTLNNTAKFYNKDGTLTTYAFACGYIEKFEIGDNRITLWKDSYVWQIQGMINNEKIWDSYDPGQLTQARKKIQRI